jgi:large subunit ribosomal protein L17
LDNFLKKIGNKKMTSKLFAEVSPKYKDQKGGYTRIIKLPIRANGAVKMAQIELV